jgi:hypothetical protein
MRELPADLVKKLLPILAHDDVATRCWVGVAVKCMRVAEPT